MLKLSILLLGLIGVSANAARLDICQNAVTDRCRFENAQEIVDVYTASKCSFIQNDQIAFVSNQGRRIFSVDTSTCRTSKLALPSPIIDTAVFNNRLVGVLSSHNVIVVDRYNDIYELMNSKNKPYKVVNGVKVEEGQLILKQLKNADVVLSEKQVRERMAKKSDLLDIAN